MATDDRSCEPLKSFSIVGIGPPQGNLDIPLSFIIKLFPLLSSYHLPSLPTIICFASFFCSTDSTLVYIKRSCTSVCVITPRSRTVLLYFYHSFVVPAVATPPPLP